MTITKSDASLSGSTITIHGRLSLATRIMPREERGSIAAQLVQQFPTHAPAWELHAQFVENPAAKLEAIDRGLAARPDPDTRDSLLIQKALTLDVLGERERALKILEPMTASIGDSFGTQPKAFLALAMIRSRKPPPAS